MPFSRPSLPRGRRARAPGPGTIRIVGEEATTAAPTFGTAIYTFSEAAQILVHRAPELRAATLRRWVAGGLAPPSVGLATGKGALLSFHDLVSLEVVRRFRQEGVSLRRVQKLEQALRELRPDTARAFADNVFFTDGAKMWVELGGENEPNLVEAVGKRPNQYAWRPAIKRFAKEVRFGSRGEAVAWALSDRIEIDPKVQFGEPVVKGTRLPISVIARELVTHSAEQVADWHAVDVEDVRDVRDFLAA
jgi:uncharacterized protein (DUF433 family)